MFGKQVSNRKTWENRAKCGFFWTLPVESDDFDLIFKHISHFVKKISSVNPATEGHVILVSPNAPLELFALLIPVFINLLLFQRS